MFKNNSRLSAFLLVFIFIILSIGGIAYIARAGTLEFNGVPVDITTESGEDLVIVPGEGGNTQIGDASGTNSNATDNDDLHITGVLETDGACYFDSVVRISSTLTTNTIVSSGADLALNPASSYGLTSSTTLNAATGNEVCYDLSATVNKATSGNYTVLKLNATETSAPGTADKLIDLQVGGTSKFIIDNTGALTRVPTEAHDFSSWSLGVADSNVDDATLYINPASAASDRNLLGIGVAGSPQFMVDAEGDVFCGSLTAAGSINVGTTTISTLIVENKTTLGDGADDDMTFNASTLSIPNGLNISGGNIDFDDGDLSTTGTVTTTNLYTSTIYDRLGGNIDLENNLDGLGFMIRADAYDIGTDSLTTTEWGNLVGLNQTLATSSSPTFGNLTLSGTVECTQVQAAGDDEHRIIMDPSADLIEIRPGDSSGDVFWEVGIHSIRPSGTSMDIGGSGSEIDNVYVSGNVDFGTNTITDGAMSGDWSLTGAVDITDSGWPTFTVERNVDTGLNSIRGAMLLERGVTSGDPLDGIGTAFYFKAPDEGKASTWVGICEASLQDVSDGTEIGQIALNAAWQGGDPFGKDDFIIEAVSATDSEVIIPYRLKIGANSSPAEALDVAGNITATGTVTADTLGAGAGTFTTLDTGQGAYELYAMDQDVQTTDTPQFDILGIGTAASSTDGLIVDKTETASYEGIDVNVQGNPASAAQSFIGNSSMAVLETSSQNVTSITAMSAWAGALPSSGYTGTVTEVTGVSSSVNMFGNAAGDDPSVTNAYGFKIAAVGGALGTSVDNAYGLHIPSITTATNNWGIAINTADNYINGSLSVGKNTAPTVALDVTGAITSTLDITSGDDFVATDNFEASLGTNNTPSHTFTGDLGTGMWSSAAETLNFSTAGLERLEIDATEATFAVQVVASDFETAQGGNLIASQGLVGTPSHTFRGNLDTGMWNSAPDALNFATNAVERLEIDATEATFTTDIACVAIETDSNEKIAFDTIGPHTITAQEEIDEEFTESWSKADEDDILLMTGAVWDTADAITYGGSGGRFDLEITYNDSTDEITVAETNFAENDVVRIFIVYLN
jgi:hypothetical protein